MPANVENSIGRVYLEPIRAIIAPNPCFVDNTPVGGAGAQGVLQTVVEPVGDKGRFMEFEEIGENCPPVAVDQQNNHLRFNPFEGFVGGCAGPFALKISVYALNERGSYGHEIELRIRELSGKNTVCFIVGINYAEA